MVFFFLAIIPSPFIRPSTHQINRKPPIIMMVTQMYNISPIIFQKYIVRTSDKNLKLYHQVSCAMVNSPVSQLILRMNAKNFFNREYYGELWLTRNIELHSRTTVDQTHRTRSQSVHDAMNRFWNISSVNSQHKYGTFQQFVTNIQHPQYNAINCLFLYQFCARRTSKCEQQYTNKYEQWMNGNIAGPLNILYANVSDISYLVCGHSHFFSAMNSVRFTFFYPKKNEKGAACLVTGV